MTAGVSRSILVLATGCLIWLGGAVSGLGQVDHAPPGIPSSGPSAGMTREMTNTAVIDTGLAILEFAAAEQIPTALHAVQDTVLFGDVFHLVLDFPSQIEALPAGSLTAGGDWLLQVPEEKQGLLTRLLGGKPGSGPDLSALPPTGDQVRVVRSYRVYRTNPFRFQVGPFISQVIQVSGRVEGTSEMAGIREPRQVRWSPLMVLGLFLLLLLILFLAWIFRSQCRGRDDFGDRELPPPAWLKATVELRDLLQEGLLNRGDSRAFLDGLAGIARRFGAGRYGVAAQEMTGREIARACADLGYRSIQPGPFARMIDEVDHRRYNPEASGGGWCRDQAILLYVHMDKERILPRYSKVSVDLQRQGETAWTEVGRELSIGAGGVLDAGVAKGREI